MKLDDPKNKHCHGRCYNFEVMRVKMSGATAVSRDVAM